MTNKETDIKLDGPPNSKYEKFFEKFKEIDSLNVESWNATHILAYFVKKYKDTYSVDYKFKFNNPAPSKCFEIFQIKRLSMNLTSQPKLLKEYIDWVFDTKVVKAKKRFTSVSFLLNDETVKEYKLAYLFAGQRPSTLDRSTVLPDSYKSVFAKSGITVNTYGDLSFLTQMDPMTDDISQALIELEKLGFNQEMLRKIV